MKIILPEDPESATYQTDIKGWVSRTGSFYGNQERVARYVGATHVKCKCGEVIPQTGHMLCKACRDKKERDAYAAMPKKKWDGEGCVYSRTHEQYFWSMEEIVDFAYDKEIGHGDLDLVICEPVYARVVDEYYFEECLPEDTSLEDADPELWAKLNDLNEYILSNKKPLSWIPCEFATEV